MSKLSRSTVIEKNRSKTKYALKYLGIATFSTLELKTGINKPELIRAINSLVWKKELLRRRITWGNKSVILYKNIDTVVSDEDLFVEKLPLPKGW